MKKAELNFNRKTILFALLTLLYLVIAIISFVFSSLSQETVFENGGVVGDLLALSSLPYLLIFVIEDGFNNPKKSVYAAFGIIGIVLGITCFFLETEDILVLDTICTIRGIFDIIRLTVVLTDIIPMVLVEKRKIELVDFAVSIGETVIAVFLIIKGFNHVRTHFFYMGCASIILLLKYVVVYFHKKRIFRNEKSADSH